MPRNINVVPLDNANLRHQGNNGTQEGYCRLVDAVLLVGCPENQHAEEDRYSPVLDSLHLAHGFEFIAEPFHTALNLRLFLLFLHPEDDLGSNEPADQDEEDVHREGGLEPVLIAERTDAKRSCNQGSGQKRSPRSGKECVGSQIDLEEVLQHQVTSEVVAMLSASRSVDGAYHHHDRKQNGSLCRSRRYECGKNQVDDDEAENHAPGTLAELYHEPKGKPFGYLSLDKHRCQDEREYVQPHHRVSELGIGYLVSGDVGQHYREYYNEGGQIIRYGLGDPEHYSRHKDGEHSIVCPDKTVEPQLIETLKRRSREGTCVKIVQERYPGYIIQQDEHQDSERAAEALHGPLEAGFLHLRQLLDLIVVQVQNIHYFQFLYGFFISMEL